MAVMERNSCADTSFSQNRTAGCVFWPGSDVEIMGVRPTYYLNYNGSMPYQDRVQTVLDWLDFPRMLIKH